MSAKIGMIGIIGNPVKSLSSHNGGWTRVCMEALKTVDPYIEIDILTEKDDWSAYDALVVNEGVNYKPGQYNFFGGVSDATIAKLEKFSKFKGNIFSINNEVDYNEMCQKRKELIGLRSTKFVIPEILNIDLISRHLVLGDSHSLSVFQPGCGISRNDGKTLHGFLKDGLKNYVSEDVEELTFYAGNIDVRFHFHTHGHSEITRLLDQLEDQLLSLNLGKVNLVCLLPIEDESRKIPGTGKYKGQNFCGGWVFRSMCVRTFNRKLLDICDRNGWNLLDWPYDYEEALSFDEMEARQSVHLRPTSYMFAEQLNIEKK